MDDMVWEDGGRRRRPTPPSSRRPPLWLLGVVVVLCGLLAWPLIRDARGPGERLEGVPEALQGRWTTSSERYADRWLEIGSERVVLAVGDGATVGYRIDEVRGWAVNDHDAYFLVYDTPEGETTLELYLHRDGILRLKNPSEVQWTRQR